MKAPSPANPKAHNIERKKKLFLERLKQNGGVVSEALYSAGLARRTAYEHLKTDKQFADRWQEALEISHDDLFAEARRRAIEGEPIVSAEKKGRTTHQRKKSDTLLIFLMKNAERHRKWRGRLILTGNLALDAVRTAGSTIGLTNEQILFIQKAMSKEFENVSLI